MKRAIEPRTFCVAHQATTDLSLRHLILPQLLAVIDSGGEAVGISGPGPFVDELTRLGVRHVSLSTSTRARSIKDDLVAACTLWQVLRREHFDVLHTHNPKPGAYGRPLARLAGVPCVVNTVHGLFATEADPWLKRALVYAVETLAARFSHAELVQNPEDVALLKNLPLYPRNRCRLLGNGVDLQRFDPQLFSASSRSLLRRSLGLSGDQIAVATVGRLVVEKGYLELFAAARELGHMYAFFVVGPEDPEKSDALGPDPVLQAKASGVSFLGMRSDVAALYSAFDIFVLPSHREGFPRAAMEASAMGLPVVATDIRGCRQVVEDGVNGLLVPLRDSTALTAAIAKLAEDDRMRHKMGDAGRRRARRLFDESQVVQTVMDTYKEVVDSQNASLRGPVTNLLISAARRVLDVITAATLSLSSSNAK